MSDSESELDPTEEFFYIIENEDPEENLKKLKHFAKDIEFTQEQLDSLSETLVGAAENYEMKLLKFLVKLGVKDDDNRALYFACEYGHYEIVMYLLEHGSVVDDDIKKLLKDGDFYSECARKNWNVFEKLLYDETEKEQDSIIGVSLQDAAETGNLKSTQKIFNLRPKSFWEDTNFTDEPPNYWFECAVSCAHHEGHKNVLEWLLTRNVKMSEDMKEILK